MSNFCFVLPDGMGLGGVTSWSIKMASALAAQGQKASLLEHVNQGANWNEAPDQRVLHLRCEGRNPAFVELEDVPCYLSSYQQVMPATFVPSFTEGTYASCARASQEDASKLRVLGYAHTDQGYYYDLLSYYEPIIHTFVAVSEEVATNLGRRIPHRRNDIHVKPYGVHVPHKLKRSWTGPGKPLKLAYAGRLVEDQKRISDLVVLVAWLMEFRVDFHLKIVGTGSDEDKLMKGLAALGKDAMARVEFVGRLPAEAMPEIWRTADVSVLVSEYEGTSISMLESMAQGCVPVVTKVSGTQGALRHGKTGFLVRIGHMRRMAKILKQLDRDRTILARMGVEAHHTALARYSFEEYVKWFTKLSRDVWAMPARTWPTTMGLLPPVRCGSPPPPQTGLWFQSRRFGQQVMKRVYRYLDRPPQRRA